MGSVTHSSGSNDTIVAWMCNSKNCSIVASELELLINLYKNGKKFDSKLRKWFCALHWVVPHSICAIWYPSRAVSAGVRRGVRLFTNESISFHYIPVSGWSHHVHQKRRHTNRCHIPLSSTT